MKNWVFNPIMPLKEDRCGLSTTKVILQVGADTVEGRCRQLSNYLSLLGIKMFRTCSFLSYFFTPQIIKLSSY